MEIGNRTAEFLASEGNGTRSREVVTLASGQNVQAGAVLGKLTSGGKYRAVAPGASTGAEVAAAIAYEATDATGGDTSITVIAREAEVYLDKLVFPSGTSQEQIDAAVAQLAEINGPIIAR